MRAQTAGLRAVEVVRLDNLYALVHGQQQGIRPAHTHKSSDHELSMQSRKEVGLQDRVGWWGAVRHVERNASVQ